MIKKRKNYSPIKSPGKLNDLYESAEDIFEIIQPLIDRRIKKEMSQKDLAHIIGVHQSAIARFESGTSNPTLLFLIKVASALDLRVTIDNN